MANKQTIYVTTPIYYASGDPHIGHAFTTIFADTYCGYQKLLGNDVLFLTGMDEHGQKIAEKASKEGKDPQSYVNDIAIKFKKLWEQLHIDYDRFVRTSDQTHCEVIKKVFDDLYQNKQVYLGKWQGLYCVQCEENYKLSDAIKKDGKLYCKVGHELVNKSEETYFLKMKEQQGWLEQYYAKHPDFIIPNERVRELVNNFIHPGLEDLSVTRTSIQWGVPTNTNHNHVLYVWIDALMAYLSGLGYNQEQNQDFKKYWQNKSGKRVHFIGKEITRFHGIYWPILLKDLNLNLPTQIVSHSWIITKEGKMSKSLGNVVDPVKVISNYGADFLRYFLLKNIGLDRDGIYSEDLAVETYNSDLANNYGNLISRTLGMINKYNNGQIPKIKVGDLGKAEQEIVDGMKDVRKQLSARVNDYQFAVIINKAMDLCNLVNKYIEDSKPWELVKAKNKKQLGIFLNLVANVAMFLTWLLSPILKDGIPQACDQYGVSLSSLNYIDRFDLNKLGNHKVNQSAPIYQRIKNI